MKIGNINIPDSLSLAIISVGIIGLILSPSSFELLISFIALFFSLKLVSFPHQPGIIFFIFFFHWVQISFYLFSELYLGIDLNIISETALGRPTIVICSIGLIFLALGYRFWLSKIQFESLSQLRHAAHNIRSVKVVYLYALFFLINLVINPILFVVPSLTQLLIRIAELKVLILFILIYTIILQKKNYVILIIILTIEFILGFTGYFSGFKDVILYFFIALIPFVTKLRWSYSLIIGLSSVLFFSLAINWQAVKREYRDYLSQGTRTQTVKVSRRDALTKAQDLLFNVSKDQRVDATIELFGRIAYTRFIASAMEIVPSFKPHQNGKIWLQNFTFAAIPRFLDPSKEIKDDSKKVNEYTRFRVATRLEGTSVSLGYFGECYIDFGYVGMMLMLTFLGFLIGGLFYLFYVNINASVVVKHAFLNVVFFYFYDFGNDGTVVAGMITINAIYYTIIFLLIVRPITNYISR